jgi:hypothetical protein
VDGGALLDLALGPDLPAVPADDATHRGQSDPRSRKIDGPVQPLEGQEELVDVGHVEAGAVVGHEQSVAAAGRLAADSDARGGVVGREFPRVAEEVLHDLPEERRVAFDEQARGNLELDTPFRLGPTEVLDDGSGQLREIDWPSRHLDPARPRELQQVVDELTHLLRGLARHLEILPPPGVEPGAVVLQRRLAEAGDRAERRAQVVRHRVAEGLQFPVRDRQVPVALLQLPGHPVEGVSHFRQLVGSLDADPVVQVSRCDLLRAIPQVHDAPFQDDGCHPGVEQGDADQKEEQRDEEAQGLALGGILPVEGEAVELDSPPVEAAILDVTMSRVRSSSTNCGTGAPATFAASSRKTSSKIALLRPRSPAISAISSCSATPSHRAAAAATSVERWAVLAFHWSLARSSRSSR